MRQGVEELSNISGIRILPTKISDIEYNKLYWQNNKSKIEFEEKESKNHIVKFNECLEIIRKKIQ